MNAPADLDVIIPVRGAGPAFRRCVASLIRHARPGRDRMVVVLDGPPDAEVTRAVGDLRSAGLAIDVRAHDAPRGFVASVNLGLDGSARDVVLLNSDTRVTARWLEKLSAAAYSADDIATVTPFSNNATICSLPRFLAENALPAGYDTDRFGALVEARSSRRYPELPTGVGVCLLIKRAALDAVGALDPAFGEGYGEEVDFCLRASRAGWRHVLDDATFVFHEGSRSFGASRARRVRRAHRRLARRAPEYLPMIADFIRRDPLAPLRARVTSALVPSRPAAPRLRIVHVVHGWPPWAHGGTEHYAAWLARRQAATSDVAVYARLADPDRGHGDATEFLDDGVRVRLVTNNFTSRNPIVRHALHSRVLARDFDRFLDETRPDLVHVHHLSGHCASLMRVARRRGLAIVYQAQDWWPACARVNLWHKDGHICDGPTPRRCSACLPLTSRPGAAIWNPWLHRLRASWLRRALGLADAYVMGSRFMETTGRQWRLFAEGRPRHVLPYGVPIDARPVSPRPVRRPIRVGYIGAWMPHKGVDVLLSAFEHVDPADAELHVWGSSGDRSYADRVRAMARPLPHVHLHGHLPDASKAETLAGLDLLVMPSVGWESFGLVAREAMALGVPVVASDRAALGELFESGGGGRHVLAGDAQALATAIGDLAASPEIIERWRRTMPAAHAFDEHADAIERMYGTVLGPARDRAGIS